MNVGVYRNTTRHHNPEELDLNFHRRETSNPVNETELSRQSYFTFVLNEQ
jgi:hypothetical protein